MIMDWMLLESLIGRLQDVSVSNCRCHVDVRSTRSVRCVISCNVQYSNTAIECRVLPVFTNGMIVYATDVTSDFDLGTTATYSCNEGYTLDLSIGVEVRTCIDDGDNAVGVFSDQEPACVRKYCMQLIIVRT